MREDPNRRIHHVSCAMSSDDTYTEDWERVQALAKKIERYARGLGFTVLYDNVDRPEVGDG